MDRRWLVGIGPFALLVIASCGSSSGSGANSMMSGSGDDASSSGGGDDASSSSGAGDDTGDGSMSSSGGGADGSGTSSGTDASSSEAGATAGASADVPQMHKHINRDGFFVDSALTETALMGATLHLDATFAGTFTGNAYASPIYVSDGVNHKGTFYIATESNNLYALDEATGMNAIPTQSAGTPAQKTGAGCGNISPIGITGTPAIGILPRGSSSSTRQPRTRAGTSRRTPSAHGRLTSSALKRSLDVSSTPGHGRRRSERSCPSLRTSAAPCSS